jgi:hypothetical protein
MCFSAEASFTASVFLAGTGAFAMRAARGATERPVAAIPFLFAVQQALEGLVWLSFDWQDAQATRALGQAYSLFAYILWPSYVPVASWLAEPRGRRRTLLGGAAVAGLFVGTVLAWSLAVDPVTPTAAGTHIDYESRQLLGPATVLLYLMATTGSLLASSQPFLRLFGALVLGAFALAYSAYARWFVSVWCFFVAWLSVVLLLHFASRRGRAARPADRPA